MYNIIIIIIINRPCKAFRKRKKKENRKPNLRRTIITFVTQAQVRATTRPRRHFECTSAVKQWVPIKYGPITLSRISWKIPIAVLCETVLRYFMCFPLVRRGTRVCITKCCAAGGPNVSYFRARSKYIPVYFFFTRIHLLITTGIRVRNNVDSFIYSYILCYSYSPLLLLSSSVRTRTSDTWTWIRNNYARISYAYSVA